MTLTIVPPPDSRMIGRNSCTQRNAPTRFTSISRRKSAVVSSLRLRLGRLTPALLMRTVGDPSCCLTACAIAPTCDSSATSHSKATSLCAVLPAARTTSSNVFFLLPTSATLHSRWASMRTISRPTPLPAPVTTAIFFRLDLPSKRGASPGGARLDRVVDVDPAPLGVRPHRRIYHNLRLDARQKRRPGRAFIDDRIDELDALIISKRHPRITLARIPGRSGPDLKAHRYLHGFQVARALPAA